MYLGLFGTENWGDPCSFANHGALYLGYDSLESFGLFSRRDDLGSLAQSLQLRVRRQLEHVPHRSRLTRCPQQHYYKVL